MRIALMAEDPAFGNCVGLYRALSLKHDVTAVFHKKGRPEKLMWEEIPHVLDIKYVPKRADHYIIIGAQHFVRLGRLHPGFLPYSGNDKVTVVLTDSMSRNRKQCLQEDLVNYRVFCMADLAPFYNCVGIYYHPFEYEGEVRKNGRMLVSHSPFSLHKKNLKGTRFIKRVIEEIGVELEVIAGVSWRESIERKSKAHIFVDQVIPPDEIGWHGGLGKSGIEGMATGCLTMTSGRFADERSSIPPPPVVQVTREDFKDKLLHYITHDDEREMLAREQKRWVEKYLNYEFQSTYLI